MGSTLTIDFDIARKQLSAFVKDPKTIRDLEALFRLLNSDLVTLLTSKVDETREIISGPGLTGGGDLSGDLTLAVGAGTGIVVNADDVAIDTTAEAERIRDVIGAALVAGANITVTVNDAGDTITIASTGGYTAENAQDDVGGILTDTASIDFTYDDATPKITADLKNTTVTPGSYTNANIVIGADGRVTSASNGTTGGGGSAAGIGVSMMLAAGTFTH
jgi:hypothetical protein